MSHNVAKTAVAAQRGFGTGAAIKLKIGSRRGEGRMLARGFTARVCGYDCGPTSPCAHLQKLDRVARRATSTVAHSNVASNFNHRHASHERSRIAAVHVHRVSDGLHVHG